MMMPTRAAAFALAKQQRCRLAEWRNQAQSWCREFCPRPSFSGRLPFLRSRDQVMRVGLKSLSRKYKQDAPATQREYDHRSDDRNRYAEDEGRAISGVGAAAAEVGRGLGDLGGDRMNLLSTEAGACGTMIFWKQVGTFDLPPLALLSAVMCWPQTGHAKLESLIGSATTISQDAADDNSFLGHAFDVGVPGPATRLMQQRVVVSWAGFAGIPTKQWRNPRPHDRTAQCLAC